MTRKLYIRCLRLLNYNNDINNVVLYSASVLLDKAFMAFTGTSFIVVIIYLLEQDF